MSDCNSGDMTAAKEIKSLLKEAQIYQSQGLLKEARVRYENAVELVKKDDTLGNKSQLLAGIEKKIQSLDEVTYKVEKKTIITEISPRDKDLIKRLFSTATADDKDTSILEGAVALAKFGQFDRAIADFEELLENSPLRIVAAKHILRCHMAMRALHDPMTQFHRWESAGNFGEEELSEISTFLHRTYGLSTAGEDESEQNQTAPPVASVTQPEVKNPPVQPQPPPKKSGFDPIEDEYVDVLDVLKLSSGQKGGESHRESADGFVDVIGAPAKKQTLRYEDIVSYAESDYVDYISSVGIPLKTGETINLPVNLQTGSVVNLIIPAGRQPVIEMLKKGALIEGIKLNSPISVNIGNCTVVSLTRIDMGPKKGDYSVDLKVES